MNIVSLASLRTKLQYFIFYSILALGMMAPVAVDSYIPALADYINHLSSIIQAKMALMDGQFPLRIAPLDQAGWGYPSFQFYSPSTYTFAALVYLLLTPQNPLIAYKITIWCGLMLGGIYMNRLCYWFVKSRPAALLASVAYLMSPYYIVVVNDFCDLSEILSLGIAPAVFYYTFKRFYQPTHVNLLQMGLFWYLLITIHSVSFIYIFFTIALILTFLTIKNLKHLKNLIQVFIGIGFAVMLAMWYLAPISTFGNDILISQTFSKSSSFTKFSPVISQLLFPGGTQFKNNLYYNHPAIGWTLLLSVGICTYAFFQKGQIHHKRANYWLPILLITFYILFLMAWSPLDFWQWLPTIMRIGQYSWRLLGELNGIGALLFAWAICYLFQDKLDLRHVIIGIVCIVLLSSQWFPTINNSNIDLNKFKKHPFSYYNENSYAINFNKNTRYVDSIDTIIIYSLMAQNKLQLNIPYFIPKSLLDLAVHPRILIEGQIEDKNIEPHTVSCLVNNKIIATKTIKSGAFHWIIPLDEIQSQFKETNKFDVLFKMNKKIVIPVKKVVLTGFLDPEKTLSVKAMEPNCLKQGTYTVCTISVSNSVNLIELPILYYPKLLNIFVNGKKTSYQSVLYHDFLITGIKPINPGVNQIEIQFKGLNWGNSVSRFSWILWFFLLFSVILNRKIKHK